MAQSYSLTETRLSSDELNAKTASTLVAIKNLSATNNYYFVGNTGAAPYSAADFSDAAVFVWQPVEEGVAGSYYLMKPDGTYMQASSPKDFGTVDGAAVFTSSNPTTANGQFNGDSDSQAFIDDEALLVRFMNTAAGNWINVQNGDNGTPVYNNGPGGWTIHYVYAVEAATVEPEPEVDEATVALIAKANEVLAIEGIGYPAAGPRSTLKEAIEVAEETPTTEAGVALQAAIDAYYAATEIVLPEAGKVYTFTAVWSGNEYYIYNNNGTLAVAARSEEALPESAQFVCEYNADEEYKFQFKTTDGQYYLAYPTLGGKSWLDNESETGLEATASKVTMFNVNKILAGGAVEATNDALFGLIQMDGYRGYDNGKLVDAFGPIVVKHSALTFDGAAAPFYNSNFTSAFSIEEVVATEPEPSVETFAVTADLFPTVEGDVTEIKGIRVEAGQGPALANLPTEWTLTNEAGDEFTMNIEWLYDYETILIMVNPAITEAGTYTLTIPAGSLKTDDGKECEAAEFSWTIAGAVVEETFPKLSNDETRYYYKIASYNRGGYLSSVGDGAGVQHVAETMASYWYFTKADENGGVYFHNYTSEQTLGADRAMSDTPAIWYVLANGVNEEGHAISSTNPISSSSCIDANNYNTGVGSWNPSASDWHGTTWVFSEVDVDAMIAELQAARDAFDAAYAEAQRKLSRINTYYVGHRV